MSLIFLVNVETGRRAEGQSWQKCTSLGFLDDIIHFKPIIFNYLGTLKYNSLLTHLKKLKIRHWSDSYIHVIVNPGKDISKLCLDRLFQVICIMNDDVT